MDIFLQYYSKLKHRTRRVIDCIPVDKIEWTYKEGKFTFGDVIRHLANIERYMFAENAQFRPSKYSGCGTEFASGHSETVDYFSRLHEESVQIFSKITPEDLNRKCTTPAGTPITLWKWLCGGSLTASELTSYNLTKNMDTVSEMYRVLIGIMRLFVAKGTYYLFLLDEMEGLKNIRNQDCRESFHDAFRKLADDDNDVLGFIVSIFTVGEDDIPDFIYTQDIVTRLNKANIHALEYLAHDDDVRQFLKDLLALVIDDEKKKEKEKQGQVASGLEYYPLTDEAMDGLVNLAISAPTASLPRNFISALNEGAVHAARRDSYVIDTDDLKPAQAIFTEGV